MGRSGHATRPQCLVMVVLAPGGGGRALLGAGRSPLVLGGLAVLIHLPPSERWPWARRGSRRCPDGEQAAHLARPQAQLLAALDEGQLVDRALVVDAVTGRGAV